MIRLENIVKRYNLHKPNEFVVLNGISLELPETGLVVLLGSSGSGKTTLLNVISGLHSFDSGSIQIEDTHFKEFKDRSFSKLRQNTFGFIFQNYQLLEQATVEENIKLALNFSDLTFNQDEIVMDALNAVGLGEYHNRKAMYLSGGEQQRVAIARALCKQPKILLADEPTGNLDSKNSVQIMDLIKEISKTKLVVLVTHDEPLANVYADRIIHLANGVIMQDYVPEPWDKSVLSQYELKKDDSTLNVYKGESTEIHTYGDPFTEPLEIVHHNNTLYLETDKPVRNIIKQETLSYPMMKQRELKVDPHPLRNKFKLSFKMAWNQLKSYGLKSRLFLIALAVVGIVLSITLGLYGKAIQFKDDALVTKYRDYVTVELKDTSVSQVKELDFGPDVIQEQYIMDEIKLYIKTPVYYEVDNVISIYAHPTLASVLTNEDLVLGRLPENEREVVLDRKVANELLQVSGERGIDQLQDLLHASIVINASGSLSDQSEDSLLYFPIVGISMDDTPTVFMSEELMYSLALGNIITPELLPYDFELTGRMPATYREVLVNDHYVGEGSFVPRSVGTTVGSMEVTGYYEVPTELGTHNYKHILISTLDYMKDVYFTVYNVESYGSELLLLTNDVEGTVQYITAQNKTAYSQYLLDVEAETRLLSDETMSVTIYTVVAFLAAAISIYFISRASLLHRMKSIAILRALGATKATVLLLFVVELLLIATITSVLFFVATTLGLLSVQSTINELFTIFDYPLYLTSSAIGFLYLVQLVFGLLPVAVVLGSTPADLFSKYDIS